MKSLRLIGALLTFAIVSALFVIAPTPTAQAKTGAPYTDPGYQNWAEYQASRSRIGNGWVSLSPYASSDGSQWNGQLEWKTYGPKGYNLWDGTLNGEPDVPVAGEPQGQKGRVIAELGADVVRDHPGDPHSCTAKYGHPFESDWCNGRFETFHNSGGSQELRDDYGYGQNETMRVDAIRNANQGDGRQECTDSPEFILTLTKTNGGGTPFSGYGLADAYDPTSYDSGSRNWHYEADLGPVARVGQLRSYINAELESGVGSEYYHYQLEYALWYLDIVYTDGNNAPIDMLCIPKTPRFYCLDPRGWQYGYTDKQIPLSIYRRGFQQEINDFCIPPTDTTTWEYSYECDIAGRTCNGERSITGPYQEQLIVSDASPSGVGKTDFTTQQAVNLTPFGRELQEICEEREASNRPCVIDGEAGEAFNGSEMDRLEAAAQQARSNPTPTPEVDLTESNQRALAEGRLVDVDHYSHGAIITISGQANRYMRRLVTTTTHYNATGDPTYEEKSYGEWEYANQPDMDMAAGTGAWSATGNPAFKDGYQILVNHCNGDAFDAVAGSRSIDQRAVTDRTFTGSYVAASAVSPAYTNRGDRPWGVTGPTAETGFYDKVCSWQGTLSDLGGNSTTAKVDTRNTNKFFRDGERDLLATNYYTPTSGGWIDATNVNPDAFTATRWLGGTPIRGQFFISGYDASNGGRWVGPLFGTSRTEPPVLKQWTLNTFSSEGVAIGKGATKQLFTSALWAASKAKPQVLTVKWDFTPSVATVIPTTAITVSGSGNPSYTKETVGAPVRGQVWSSSAGAAITVPQRGDYVAHTGTGTENTLDVPTPAGTNLNGLGQWLQYPADFSDHYYVVDYRRAVTG